MEMEIVNSESLEGVERSVPEDFPLWIGNLDTVGESKVMMRFGQLQSM